MVSGIQGGKTTWGAREAFRLMQAGSPGLGMIVAPDYPLLKQATMRKVFQMWPRDLWRSEWGGAWNKSDRLLRLVDGNEVLFRSATDPDALRGPTLKWFWLDEITLCERDAWQVLQGRVLATGGRGIATGTPKASAAWVRDMEGKPGYGFVGFASRDNPGIDLEVLESLAGEWSSELRRQELGGEWVDWGDAVFPEALIKGLLTGVDWTLPAERAEGKVHILSCDPAGWGQDYTVLLVLQVGPPHRVVAVERWRTAPFERMYQTAKALVEKYRPQTFIQDSTALGGQAILEEMQNRLHPLGVSAEGFAFSEKSKGDLLQNLIVMMERELIKAPYLHALVTELRNYRWNDKGLETDSVMALALAAWAARVGRGLNVFI